MHTQKKRLLCQMRIFSKLCEFFQNSNQCLEFCLIVNFFSLLIFFPLESTWNINANTNSKILPYVLILIYNIFNVQCSMYTYQIILLITSVIAHFPPQRERKAVIQPWKFVTRLNLDLKLVNVRNENAYLQHSGQNIQLSRCIHTFIESTKWKCDENALQTPEIAY